jgi:predicted dehydrogenase
MRRRQFISKTGKGALAGAFSAGIAWPAIRGSRIDSANERVNLALIGCGGRGEILARGFVDDGAEIVYVCDAHADRMAGMAQLLGELQGKKPQLARDRRTIYDDKDIDGVVIATPHHWHALPMIEAVQAGKDVYLEKPPSLTMWESSKMLEASRKYGRIVQIGTQNRSAPYVHAAREYIESGKLGDIHLVKVYNLKSNPPCSPRGQTYKLGQPEKAPQGLDWDLWLGGSPSRPYYPTIFDHYGWVAFWDFAVGDIDDAIHQLDIALYLMGEPMPTAVSSSGGQYHYKDTDAEIPDLQMCLYDFANFVMTLEISGYPAYMEKTSATIRRNDEFPYWTQNATRVELYGSKELMLIGRHGGGYVSMTSGGKIVDKMYGRVPDEPHLQNFLSCLKTRNRPNGDIELVMNSMNTAHLSNIAYRTGNKKLNYYSTTGKFLDNDQANALMKRAYRPKYAVPEKV